MRTQTTTITILLFLLTLTAAFPLPFFSPTYGRYEISSNDEDWEEARRMEELHEGRRGWGYSVKKEGKHTRPDFHMGEGWV